MTVSYGARMTDSDNIRAAEALLTQGDVLRSQDRDAEAEPLYLRAVSLFEKTLGVMDVKVAEGCLRLADLNRFFSLDPEAIPLCRRALNIMERALGAAHPRVADVLLQLGDLYADDDPSLAVTAGQHYKRALDILEKNLGEGRTLADVRPDLLAVLHELQGEYADSESLHRWALDVLTEELGPDHLRVAALKRRLGRFCCRRGRFDEGVRFMQQALDIAERVLGPEHPGLRPYLSDLADHYMIYDLGEMWSLETSSRQRKPRMDIARQKETLHLRALAIAEESFGKDHPAVVRDLIALEALYRELERNREAQITRGRILAIIDRVGADKRFWAIDTLLRLREPSPAELSADADALFQRARALAESEVEGDETVRNDALCRLAELCLQERRPSEAAHLFARARVRAERAFGTAHPRVACVLLRTGLAYYSKDNAQAQRYYDEAIDMLKGLSCIDDPGIADELLSYALIYQEMSRIADAIERFGAAVNAGQLTPLTADPPPSPDVEPSLQTLGFSPFKVNRPVFTSFRSFLQMVSTPVKIDPPPSPDMGSLFQVLLAAFTKGFGRDHPLVGTCLLALGDLRLEQGGEREAEQLYLQALAIAEKAPRDGHDLEVGSLSGLAMLYHVQKKYAEAEPLYGRWFARCEQRPHPQETNLFTPLFNLARCLADQGRRQEIEPLFRRARGIAEARRQSFRMNFDYDLVMRFYKLLGRDADAEVLAREELDSTPSGLGPSSAKVVRDLAESCRRQGNVAEAERLYRKALADCETELGPDGGTRLSPLLIGLARVYLDQGRHVDSEPLLLRAIRILEDARQRDQEENGWLLKALEDYVSLLHRMDRAGEALAMESRVASVKVQVDADREQRNRRAVRQRLLLDWDLEIE